MWRLLQQHTNQLWEQLSLTDTTSKNLNDRNDNTFGFTPGCSCFHVLELVLCESVQSFAIIVQYFLATNEIMHCSNNVLENNLSFLIFHFFIVVNQCVAIKDFWF